MYITEVPSGGGAFRWWHDERLIGGSGGSGGSGGAASAAAHGEPSWPEARVVDGMLAALRGVPSGPFALPGDGGAPSFSVDARVRLESVSPSALHSALDLIAAAGTRAARLDALATRLAGGGGGSHGAVAVAFGLALRRVVRAHAADLALLPDAVALRRWEQRQLAVADGTADDDITVMGEGESPWASGVSVLCVLAHGRPLFAEQCHYHALCDALSAHAATTARAAACWRRPVGLLPARPLAPRGVACGATAGVGRAAPDVVRRDVCALRGGGEAVAFVAAPRRLRWPHIRQSR